MMKNKKQFGIWLDYKEANVISTHKKNVELVETITSDIEDFHAAGGAPAKVKWGLGEVVPEKKYLERRKHQERDYFDRIIKSVKDADEVFLFGPAEAKVGLQSRIKGLKHFGPALRKVETADKMTENQKMAKVRDFYS